MNEIKDGGPAFPVADPFALNPRDKVEMERLASGMNLRDRFAIAALPQIQFSQYGVSGFDEIATLAYQQADAMLRARGEA